MINLQAAAIIFTPEDLPFIFECKVCEYELRRDPDNGELYWGYTYESPHVGSYWSCKRYLATRQDLLYLGFRVRTWYHALSFRKSQLTSRFLINDIVKVPVAFSSIVFLFMFFLIRLPFLLLYEFLQARRIHR